MCLIRGIKGLCPCPWCLVPAQEQQNLAHQFASRQIQQVRPIVEDNSLSITAKDKKLKSLSFRPLFVSFSNSVYSLSIKVRYIECLLAHSICKPL